MKKQTTILTMLLAGMMVVLAGCQEPFDFKVKKGESVRVRVSSRNGVLTKTAYSGKTYTEGSINYERIDWKRGDQIRLFSTNTDEVATSDGKAYFDYTIGSVGTNPADRYSNATLSFPEDHEKYGLIWVNEPSATVTVYGIYPPKDEKGEEQDATTNGGLITGFIGLNIPAPQSASLLSWTTSGNTLVGTPTDDYMTHAYMVSAPTKFKTESDDPNWNGKPYVSLDFYPIFNAFEIDLKGTDTEFPINWVSLSNEVEEGTNPNSPLTGEYRFNYKMRNGSDYSFPASGPTAESITQTGNFGYTSTVTFPANTTISSEKSVKFTILALPPTWYNNSGKKLTNLVLTVNYGSNQTKKLRLNENVTTAAPYGTPIEFPAFHKARIKGLALDGGSKWQLVIDDQVLPWIADEETTSFRNQIGISGRTPVSGYIETEEVNEPGGPVGWENYYTRLTVDCSVSDPCIVFTFTPTAPIGGYWRLSPEDVIPGSLNYFKITTSDMINGESARLQGQVMVQPVKIYIRPTAEYLALDPAPVYSIIIHCDMSPSVTFEPLFSADSEFQRPYSDGRFGYYKFVIAK